MSGLIENEGERSVIGSRKLPIEASVAIRGIRGLSNGGAEAEKGNLLEGHKVCTRGADCTHASIF